MPISPTRAIEKWKQRMANVGEGFIEGVNAVSESPTEKAANSKEKYLAGVTQAAADGRYEAGLRAVSLEDWKQSMRTKGASNMRTGVANLTPRAQAAMAAEVQAAQTAAAEVRSMPNITEGDAEARMLAMVRKMREYGRRRR